MFALSSIRDHLGSRLVAVFIASAVVLAGTAFAAPAVADENAIGPDDVATTAEIQEVADDGGVYTEEVSLPGETSSVVVEFDYSAETVTIAEDDAAGDVIDQVSFSELVDEIAVIADEYLETPEGLQTAQRAGLDDVILDGTTVATDQQQLTKQQTCRLLTRYVGLVHGGAWSAALKLVSAHPAIRVVTALGNAALFWYVRSRC